MIFVFTLIVLVVVALFYKEFMIISFDPTLAQTLRLPTELFRLLLLVLIAVTIVDRAANGGDRADGRAAGHSGGDGEPGE